MHPEGFPGGVPVIRTQLIALTFCIVSHSQGAAAQSSCEADLDGDGLVAGADLALVLGAWGPCAKCVADITSDGVVDGVDLAVVLARWGGQCVPWGTVLEFAPNPAVIHDDTLRAALIATGYPWRVRDNATGIEMLLVPPGSFNMGCEQGSINFPCVAPERPLHAVTITSPFYLGRYEVTQAQWQAKTGSNPSYFQPPITAAYDMNRPVEHVSWNMIAGAGGFLSGSGLRLPTEAEWEYACRAGTTTPFHSGPGFANGTTDDSLVSQIAWWIGNSNTHTHPVGSKASNALGLHDLLGNVWEWCGDWYAAYTSAPLTDPTGPSFGSLRVLRGGGWNGESYYVRSSYRNSAPSDFMDINLGFRVARNP
jgi:formylglycine-generating enzyme required for sulfatase activity